MTDRGPAAILSADGKTLVFSARQHNLTRLFIRTLDELQATPLAGTEEGTYQFFSPKGQWIAFFVGNRLKIVAVAGGAPVTVCALTSDRGGTWLEDDTIIFSPSGGANGPLMRALKAPNGVGVPPFAGTVRRTDLRGISPLETRDMLKVVAGSSTALGILGGVVVLGSLAAGTLAAQATATSAPAAAAPGSRDPQTPPALIVSPPADAVAVEKHPPLDGTGNFTIASTSTWADVPAMTTPENVPKGTVTMFTMRSEETQMFPGVAGPYTRNVWVYVPAGYVPGTILPLMIDHDGRADAVIQSQLIVVMDNLIAQKRLPMMAGVFIANGGDFRPSERSLEYDTVSGKYAEFIEHEVLPLAEKTAHVMFTKDPELRGVIGQSSGSAAALAMAWFHPDWYHRVISYSGTFVNIQNNAEFPRGAWAYHETLIPNTAKKPLRIWLEVGSRDNGFRSAQDTYRNWPLANNRMAEALKAKGYAYQYVWAQDAGHVERGVERQTLEEAMEWVWKRQ